MRAPTLRQLHSFVATVETGSLSAAARVLRITQPAASQQVKELERALATRLLQRGAGPVRPTAAGEAVLLQARRVQSAVEDLLSAAAAFQGGEIGRVRLGTGATACIYLLPPLLARMKQRMPGLEIVIATGNTSDMLGRVLSGSLDLALVTLAGRLDRALEARRLLVEKLAAYAPAALLPDAPSVRPAWAPRSCPAAPWRRRTRARRRACASCPCVPPPHAVWPWCCAATSCATEACACAWRRWKPLPRERRLISIARQLRPEQGAGAAHRLSPASTISRLAFPSSAARQRIRTIVG